MLPFILKDIQPFYATMKTFWFPSPPNRNIHASQHYTTEMFPVNSAEAAVPPADTAIAPYLKISAVLLHVLLHTLAEL